MAVRFQCGRCHKSAVYSPPNPNPHQCKHDEPMTPGGTGAAVALGVGLLIVVAAMVASP